MYHRVSKILDCFSNSFWQLCSAKESISLNCILVNGPLSPVACTSIRPPLAEITKFASTINNPEEFEGKINKAIESCFNGRGGPSFIDIPLDVQVELVSKTKNSPKLNQNIELNKPSSKKLLSTRNAISKAKRPVLLIGSKVESINELNKFVSSNKLPTYLSGQARGSVPFNSEYFFSRKPYAVR